MERTMMHKLVEWKHHKRRKPLILQGVRQSGKTWLLQEFGKRYYENCVYINFDEHIEYRQFFQITKEPQRIMTNLAFVTKQKITTNTLIIFDEVQEVPEVIQSLKYFCEQAREYSVIAAGSLLGISLAKPASFPVGKVDFLTLYPMSFTEFLMANHQENLVDYMHNISTFEPLPDAFTSLLKEQLKMYFIIGGMPEAVSCWCEEQDMQAVDLILKNIITAYERDFAKYPNANEYPKISLVWDSIPSQLSKENKKFLYKAVKHGARAREYEDALQWLVNAKLVYKVYRSEKPYLPLKSYDDVSAFKLYLCDVGLLRRLSSMDSSIILEGNRLFTEFKGAFTENYILQVLYTQYETEPRYWSVLNPSYEVDFIQQIGNQVIPMEVKSNENVKSKSLKEYKERFFDMVPLRVRFSMNQLSLDDDMLNIPLYMADHTDRLIHMALQALKNK